MLMIVMMVVMVMVVVVFVGNRWNRRDDSQSNLFLSFERVLYGACESANSNTSVILMRKWVKELLVD